MRRLCGVLLLGWCGVLVGCVVVYNPSHTTYVPTTTIEHNPQLRLESTAISLPPVGSDPTPTVAVKPTPSCKFTLPSDATPPAIPDLTGESYRTHADVEMALVQYIHELRQFIHTERARLEQHHRQYVRDCGA